MLEAKNNKRYMIRKMALVSVFALMLSGCSLSSSEDKEAPKYGIRDLSGGVIRSQDFGETYEALVYATDNKTIRDVGVYSLDFARGWDASLILGSQKDGLFSFDEKTSLWQNIPFPPEKVYALSSYRDTETGELHIVAGGIYDGRGKIFKSVDSGKNWDEIYTEPANETIILSLAIPANSPNTIYAGTSEGVAIKSVDGGATWSTIRTFNAPVYKIAFDSIDANTAYFLLFERGLEVTRDGGVTFLDTKSQSSDESNRRNLADIQSKQTYSVVADPSRSGTVYVGAQGELFRSGDYGSIWETVPIIESVSDHPIRSLAINPFSSDVMVFGAGRAIYHSRNGGVSWKTFQLDADGEPASIAFDPVRDGTLYVGLRSF
jgi:photosystem II stability/assembly factor-like uncharacterized protein